MAGGRRALQELRATPLLRHAATTAPQRGRAWPRAESYSAAGPSAEPPAKPPAEFAAEWERTH
eukprot:7425206-Prorocentrum_lima.AAC.1